MRLVLDTNVVVSGLIWGGIPRRLLDLGRTRRVKLFTSTILLNELTDVLSREKFAALLASQGVTPVFLMQRYGMLTRLVRPQPIERTVRDIDDDAVIATALVAKAELIVSGDRDLLALHPWRGIPILNAGDAMQRVGERIV